MTGPKRTHRCPGMNCLVEVNNARLACNMHWSKVTSQTQNWVYQSYRSGDNGDHMEAMAQAITEMNKP